MVKIKTKKQKKSPWGWLLLFFFTVVSSGGVTYLYLRFFQGEELTTLEGSTVIPEQALMATFVSTDSQVWANLQINDKSPKILSKTMEKLPEEIFGQTDINYQKDVQPWLGNMMFGFLPSVNNNYELLGVFGIKNKLQALQFANQIRQNKNYKFKIGNYQGFTIIESYKNAKESLYYALIDNKLVVTKQRKIMELAIDTCQGMPSFNNHNFPENLSLKNTVANIYIPDYLRIVKEEIYDSSLSQKIPATTIKKLGAVKSVLIGIGLEEKTIHLQAIAQIDNQIIKSKFTPRNSEIINQIPQETLFLLTGNDLKTSWLKGAEQAQEIPEFNYWLSESRNFFKILNLDLDREIFGWLDGEFAFGISGANEGLFKNFAGLNVAGTIVLETQDRPTALLTIAKVEKLAKKTDLIEINTKKIENKIVTEWTTFPQEIVLSYTWKNDKTFLMTLGSPLNKLLNIKRENSLINKPKFEEIIAPLPALNLGYFYLDMEQLMSILNTFPITKNQPLPPEINSILNSFQGIALTSTMRNETTGQFDLIFSIK